MIDHTWTTTYVAYRTRRQPCDPTVAAGVRARARALRTQNDPPATQVRHPAWGTRARATQVSRRARQPAIDRSIATPRVRRGRGHRIRREYGGFPPARARRSAASLHCTYAPSSRGRRRRRRRRVGSIPVLSSAQVAGRLGGWACGV